MKGSFKKTYKNTTIHSECILNSLTRFVEHSPLLQEKVQSDMSLKSIYKMHENI